METKSVYLTDSYQKELKTEIVNVGKSGNQDFIILNQTIFYAQGGGQPSDRGVIESKTGKLSVKSVEYNGGIIKHIGKITGNLSINQEVNSIIDWDRRYLNMQIHTAGHILDDAISFILPNAKAVKGMHGIGKKNYIEYSGTLKFNEKDILKLERKINQLRESSLKVTVEFVTLEELKKKSDWIPPNLPKSKKLRIMQIGDGKVIPDGGTQVKNTNEIPPIQISKIEHEDDNTRIHYFLKFKKAVKTTPKLASKLTISHKLDQIRQNFDQELSQAKTSDKLAQLHAKYLSKKNGLTTKLIKKLPSLSPQDKKKFGSVLNKIKNEQKLAIESAESQYKLSQLQDSSIDLTIPEPPLPLGHLHPTTKVIRELNRFFQYYGFSIGEGPEIETAEYNFRKLNLPEGHPATDLQDTLFIKEPDLLLRTHTSSVEARILTNQKPPIRVVIPGKVYRNETSNKTNSSFFHHYQGFIVDKGITIQHLKGILTLAHQFLFGNDVILRFRYKYYPEVSPGMGVDMQCKFCEGKGCDTCKHRGWIEMLGSGMIHYNTLKSCKIDPEIYTGFAFGMGLDRFVMSKFGVKDIRKLYGEGLTYN